MLTKGCCLLEHSALKPKVLICIVCPWSPFPQTVSISPISECPRYQQPCAAQNGGCGRKRLEGACLEKWQSGQFLNNKSASLLDKWMLRVLKLHLQETLIPYPSLIKVLKHQHSRILLFPSFPLWNVDISWVDRMVRARESFSYPNQHIYFNAFARRCFSMRKNFYYINGKNDGDFLPSPILSGFDNSQKQANNQKKVLGYSREPGSWKTPNLLKSGM